VYQRLLEAGLQPISTTYTALISAYAKGGNLDRALDTFKQMVRVRAQGRLRGPQCWADSERGRVGGCGLGCFCWAHHAAWCQAQRGPTGAGFCGVNASSAEPRPKLPSPRPLRLRFRPQVREGCERSVITYSALINACEKASQWELALQLFERMQQEGIAPNTVTYNSLITACTQGEDGTGCAGDRERSHRHTTPGCGCTCDARPAASALPQFDPCRPS
jgi:pentatricopeptide repeat domain-containing protein 1